MSWDVLILNFQTPPPPETVAAIFDESVKPPEMGSADKFIDLDHPSPEGWEGFQKYHDGAS